jgi:hypothetical protein
MAAEGQPPAGGGQEPALVAAADVALGLASALVTAARAGTAVATTGGRRVARLLPAPVVRPLQRRIDGQLASLARRGGQTRAVLARDLERTWAALVPVVVAAVLDELDLTAIVRERVDLDAVAKTLDVDAVVARVDVDAVVARVDVDAVVGRVDLIGLANFVVDGIDLPGIIRESSGSMASEALSGVRLQSLEADEALSRMVSRWLPRHRAPKDEPERQP